MRPQDASFLATQIPLLENRFSLSYCQDGTCVEYFLDARDTGRHVSQNLILSLDAWSGGLYVSKFYPQLFLEEASKYLSAACFYLLVCHAVHLFHLKEECLVWLETDTRVFREFYAKLKEFEFGIFQSRVGDRVCLHGVFHDMHLAMGKIQPVGDPFERI